MVIVAVVLLLVTVPICFVALFALYADHVAQERELIQTQWCEMLLRVEARQEAERHDWSLERAALLERIQRPEFKPPPPVEGPPIPDTSIQDELHLVGQVIESNPPPAA